MDSTTTPWTDDDVAALAAAHRALEHPSFAARAAELVGLPIEYGLRRLPQGWQRKVHAASESALRSALEVALTTLHRRPAHRPASTRMHKLAVAATGAAGGALGILTLALELPVTTGIMLRSIADIARAEGEDLRSAEARLACLEVFALGGALRSDDATETGYFAVRVALARQVTRAAQHLLERGLTESGAPAVLRLIHTIAGRFSTQVGEKLAAEAVPIVGSIGGAVINVAFIDHFQAMARGHFVVRRLERRYGADEVRRRYDELG
jgi:hypothetical protein